MAQQQLSLFQARIALLGLRFEHKTGMKMTSKVNTKKLVAGALGMSSRTKYPELIEALEAAIKTTEEAEAAKNQQTAQA